MAKVKNPLPEANKNKSSVYSKRTIKKSGGDDFTNNVRRVKRKSKKKKQA